MLNILKTTEGRPSFIWPVISVIRVGESTGECGSEHLSFRHRSVHVLSIFYQLCFYMILISLIWELIDFLVNTPAAVLMREAVSNIWWRLMDVSGRSRDARFFFFIFTVLSSRAVHHSGYDLFVSRLHGYGQRLELTLMRLCLCSAASLFLSFWLPSFRFGFCLSWVFFFFFKQPVLLSWRI